jgi:uncharacterized protein YfkK (UPF0435 family)
MSWTNDEEPSLRVRIALKLLLLAVQILDPYKYKHEYKEDFEELHALLNTTKTEEIKSGKKQA